LPSRALLLWLPLVLFAGIVGFQIFGPVPIGLADNGDFARILGPLRLWPAGGPNQHFKYFVNDYVVADPAYDIGAPSSEKIIASLAKRIATIVLPTGTFQLRLMGFLHAAILILALFILLKALEFQAIWLRLVCSSLLLIIWTDLEYVQQFNTAYTDAGAVVALAVVFSIAIHCLLVAGTWPWALSFALFGCFLLGTKTQHETTLPFLIAFCLLAAFRAHRKYDRTAWLLAPVLLLATSAWMIKKTPGDYRVEPAFSIVFYKLAVLSRDPKSVLADFRMPEEEFGKYVGRNAYEPGLPMDDPAFRRRAVNLVTPSSLSLFYWRHPRILGKVLVFDLHNWAPDVDLSRATYGHLRETDVRNGKHPFELVAWGRFRRQLFSVAPFYPIYLFGIVIVLAGFCILNPALGRRLPLWPVALFSALLAVSSFLFASLTDAIETTRHLVLFQAATDLTIFSVVLSICLAIEDRSQGASVPRRSWLWWLMPVIFIIWLYRGNFGSDSQSPRVTGTFDDTSSEISYSGIWTHASFPDAEGETGSFSNDAGSSARLSFEGTEITWVYARAWNRGIASVEIDGTPRGDFDLYDPKVIWQSRTTFRDLAPGKHTFEVAVTGRKNASSTDCNIDIDALIVR
jgi:hypothetical protein